MRVRRSVGVVWAVVAVVAFAAILPPVAAHEDESGDHRFVEAASIPDLLTAGPGPAGGRSPISHSPPTAASLEFDAHVDVARGRGAIYEPVEDVFYVLREDGPGAGQGEVLVVDRDGQVVRSRAHSVLFANQIRFHDGLLFVGHPDVIAELDPVTLLERARYPLPVQAGAFPPLPEYLLRVDPFELQWIQVDPVTAAETRAPMPIEWNPFFFKHLIGDGSRALAESGPVRLIDTSVWPPVQIAQFDGEWFEAVLDDGTFLTDNMAGEVIRRSGVDGAELSRTAVRADHTRVDEVAYVSGRDWILAPTRRGDGGLNNRLVYAAGGDVVGSVGHNVAGMTADGRTVFGLFQEAFWVGSARPRAFQLSQQLWRPDWFDNVVIRGVGFEGIERVRVAGVERPFATLLDDVGDFLDLHVDVSGMARDDGGVEVEIVSALGTARLDLPGTPPRGMTPLLVRMDHVDEYLAPVVRCDYKGEVIHQERVLISQPQTVVLLVPAMRSCSVESEEHHRLAFLGAATATSGPDLWSRTAPFFSDGPRFVEVLAQPSPAPVWVFAIGDGGPPANTVYRVTLTCGSWSEERRVPAGFGTRFEPPGSGRRCTAQLNGRAGAKRVRSFAVAPTNDRRPSGNTIPVDAGASVAFVADHGGADWFAPLAIASPGEKVGRHDGAGGVHLFPTRTDGSPAPRRSRFLREGSGLGGRPRGGDALGADVVSGDFDNDGLLDFAFGAPGDRAGKRRNAGAVHVAYAERRDRLAARSQTLHEGRIAGSARRANDRFGAALAVVDFNADGFDDLAVGVPGRAVGGVRNAGVVRVFLGGPDGLHPARVETYHQGDGVVGDRPERGDGFGTALAADEGVLAVGVPHEDLGARVDAGAVHVIDGLELVSYPLRQKRRGPYRQRTGNRFGAALDVWSNYIVVGAPGQDRPGRVDSGVVHSYYVLPDRWVEGSFETAESVFDVGSSNARSGSSVAILPDTQPAVLVGAPGTTVDGVVGAGAISFHDAFEGVHFSTWHQGLDEVPGSPVAGAGFGEQVLLGPRGTLVVAIPGATVNGRVDAGRVLVTADLENWRSVDQGTRGVARRPQPGDRFGAGLAS